MNVSEVEVLRARVRTFLQHPRRQDPLLKDKPNWNVLASAFDVVADTEMAIGAYEAVEDSGDQGLRYLQIYGLLQTIYVQQDAVEAIVRALKASATPVYKIEDEPDAFAVRSVRNRAVGHPTKDGDVKSRKKPGVQMSYHIVQHSMHKGGFSLMTTFADGDFTFTDVSIPEVIGKNRAVILRVLGRVMDDLEAAEVAHKKAFHGERLADIFPETLDYYFQNIHSGTRDTAGPRGQFAKLHVKLVADEVQEFRKALECRGLLNPQTNYENHLAEIEYPISEVQQYFEGSGSLSDPRSAAIFVHFIRDKIRKLEQMALELDREYRDPQDAV